MERIRLAVLLFETKKSIIHPVFAPVLVVESTLLDDVELSVDYVPR